ncbi:MAG TPA: V-type ATP synthase subunit B [Persephonella sp.]|uniref:V-type ATP synthase beta chain n=1 Tax=Persephonella marina (strain DSM 14350 / EX-H1) TaxID=123214 RepID=C0QT22_PERMH|nr:MULTISPECIES: V-type ATP synthase subunit B [Persephonella]ACO04158.1 V-type ATP synthase beta chain (V-type ATPase subunitB) [Persephonella marina EX-H1]HCB70544.1 V-type ATP synthase subunit B [Persephonella sp.]
MLIEYKGGISIKGNILFFKTVEGVRYGEKVVIRTDNRDITGKVSVLTEDITVIEILGESSGINPQDVRVRFTGEPFKIPVSEGMLGRILDPFGNPLDELGSIIPEAFLDISGEAYNPSKRLYPEEIIYTGISSIDGLNTLVKGQKLPVFAVSGVPTDQLVAQIVRQIKTGSENRATVLCAVGVKYETANYLIEDITSGGNFPKTAVFLNLADEPPVNSLISVRSALTLSEFLAFEKGYDVVVVIYDMTNYCDALREISSKRGEIPGRKGYPGYMYSDLASIYERAGVLKGMKGSVTQIPVLTMPDDDITHPIPDLTGYITEGQIVLDRSLHQRGVYPPVNVLPSLSRLMNRAVDDLHKRWANQIYSAYAKAKRVEMLASIVGETEISEIERTYLDFGRRFEELFIKQGRYEDRTLEETLSIGWDLLKLLPESELVRLKKEDIERFIK